MPAGHSSVGCPGFLSLHLSFLSRGSKSIGLGAIDRRARSVFTFVVRDTLSSSSLDDCSRTCVLLARARVEPRTCVLLARARVEPRTCVLLARARVEPRRAMLPVLRLFGA
jgi:hypothetical protein